MAHLLTLTTLYYGPQFSLGGQATYLTLPSKLSRPCNGCGAICRAVASDTRDPRFESSHRQNLYLFNLSEKTEMKKKRPGMTHFFKKTIQAKHVPLYQTFALLTSPHPARSSDPNALNSNILPFKPN